MVMKTTRVNRGAFTLTELMVVIVIIGVLMALLVPAVLKSREQARVAAAKVKMNSMGVAIDSFHRDFGFYLRTDRAFNPTTGRFDDGELYGDFGYSEALVQCLTNKWSKGTGDAANVGVSVGGANKIIGNAPVSTGPYMEVKAEDLADRDADGFPELVDEWQSAYIFVSNADYLGSDGVSYNAGAAMWTDGNGNGIIDPGEFEHYQRFKYQLISLGPDGWTAGLDITPRPAGYRYHIITLAGNAMPPNDPGLVGTDTVLANPVVDAAKGHPTGTADDINNWTK